MRAFEAPGIEGLDVMSCMCVCVFILLLLLPRPLQTQAAAPLIRRTWQRLENECCHPIRVKGLRA